MLEFQNMPKNTGPSRKFHGRFSKVEMFKARSTMEMEDKNISWNMDKTFRKKGSSCNLPIEVEVVKGAQELHIVQDAIHRNLWWNRHIEKLPVLIKRTW